MDSIVLHKKDQEYMQFTLKNTSISFANSLRRILLSEVPTIAIDIVQVHQNNSVLPDDLLVHRLGLIPMQLKEDNLLHSYECDCDSFCEKCSINIQLNVTGGEVYSNAFKVESQMNLHIENDILICKLARNQKIELTAIARKNIGKFHSKYSAVNVVEFSYDEHNEMRHTKYWYEEDVEKEWPGMKIKKRNKVSDVKMGVEVVNGNNVSDVIASALDVLKMKIQSLSEMIENYHD